MFSIETSEHALKELCNDPDHIAVNLREYINGFSSNVQEIFKELNMDDHIKKTDKDGCLYSVVKAFSELNLSIKTFDSIKMGYIFENLSRRRTAGLFRRKIDHDCIRVNQWICTVYWKVVQD